MSRKTFKAFALVASGGVLMQLAGCGTVILQFVVQNLVSGLISTLISGVNDAADTM